MFISFGELTPLSFGIIAGGIFFALQLLLCFRLSKMLLKCLPIFLILLGGLFCLAVYGGSFGSYSAGAISGNALVALVGAFILAVAFAGALLGWLVYGVSRLAKRKKSAGPCEQ